MNHATPNVLVKASTQVVVNKNATNDQETSGNTPRTLDKKWTSVISSLSIDTMYIVTWLGMLLFALLLWLCDGKRSTDLPFQPERLVEATRPVRFQGI